MAGAVAPRLTREILRHGAATQLNVTVASVLEEMVHDVELADALTEGMRVRVKKSFCKTAEEHAERLQERIQVRDAFDEELQGKLRDARQKLATQIVALSRQLREGARLQRKVDEQERLIEQLSNSARRGSTGNGMAQLPPVPTSEDEPQGDGFARTFGRLEDKILMNIFAYLGPREVLGCAQLNREAFKRVDVLFGIGTPVGAAQGETRTKTSAPTPTTPSRGAKGRSLPSASPIGAVYGEATAKAKAQALSAPLGGIDGRMLATAAAEKLNQKEIKGIISLMTRIRNLENLVSAMEVDADILLKQVSENEEVKNALMEKLADAEAELKERNDVHSRLELQAKSDAEVISFLDARVREAEGELAATRADAEATAAASAAEIKRLRDERRTLQDLLEHSKATAAAQEEDAKKTRKLLVKEVKGLRQQILSIKAQRDQYKMELAELRRSVANGQM
eukprot:scaffold1320_cov253-Pinguiococcus_pyrenoidosus.AAC.3